MIKTNLILLINLLLVLCLTSQAQELNKINQYMFNRQYINPGAVGTGISALNVGIVSRFQWVDVEGSPKTYAAWGDLRTAKQRMAVGANFEHFRFSITKNTEFSLSYSYLLPISRKFKLGMGLRGGMVSNVTSTDNLSRVWDANDPFANALNNNSNFLKIGTGFQLYSSDLYIGLASSDLFVSGEGVLANDKNKSFANRSRNYVGYAGGRVKLNETYRLLPSFIIYSNPLYNTRVDATVQLEITDYFWTGVTYISNKQLAFMAGAFVSSRVRLAYAYQFGYDKASPTILSSHEINLRFALDNLFKK